jgi:hypothetical protein
VDCYSIEGGNSMVYNMIEISRMHQQHLLRAADERRLADLAQAGKQSEQSVPKVNARSVLTEMGRGLAALGLVAPDNNRKVYR